MTTRFHQELPVRVDLLDSSSNVNVIVREAWLPMAIWDGVRVQVNARRGITLMERFVIECLLELKTCSGDDLFAIAGLPHELAAWILASLEQKGLAYRQHGDVFLPAAEVCAEALASGNVVIQQEERRTVLWFPETGEFAVLKEGDDVVRRFREMMSMGRYPLPERYKREQRTNLLTEAMALGRAYGEDRETICAITDDAIVDDECAAYHVATEIPVRGAREWRLTIRGRRKRSSRADDSGNNGNDAGREFVEQTLSLPVLNHLVDNWRIRLEGAIDGLGTELGRLGLRSANLHYDVLNATLDGHAASRMARDRLLSGRAGLSVCVDREIKYEVPVELAPGDDRATRLFALDREVRQILSAESATNEINAICGDVGEHRNELVERMWQIKLYKTIYELRAVEDFWT